MNKQIDNSRLEKPLSNTEGQVLDIASSTSRNIALVNQAIQSIGFGRYQTRLFFTCGFGFFVDQILVVSVGLVLPQITKQWDTKYPSMITAAIYAGSLVGAIICGYAVDFIGRKLMWQISLLFTTIFTLVAAASPNFPVLAVFLGLQTIGAGGNLAIDLTVFIECLPKSKDYLLTLLGLWFGVGSTIGGLFAWPLITRFSCPTDATPESCPSSENMGWRYQYILTGGVCLVLALIRIFCMSMEESTKWLASQGRFEEAAAALQKIADMNHADLSFSADCFDRPLARVSGYSEPESQRRKAQLQNMKRLFQSRKMATSTAGVCLLWMCIGIAYPLYQLYLPIYLQNNGADIGSGSIFKTYRDYSISSTVGIFGPVLAAFLVNVNFLGRRKTMAITALGAAAFAGAFTSVRNEGSNIAFSSMISFWQNAFYAILYAYTPEVMPTASRGTGCGLAVACGRIASLSSPFIGTFADLSTSAPIWVCLGLYGLIACVAVVLPFEPKHFNEEERL